MAEQRRTRGGRGHRDVVVVGVDGSEDAERATRYAVEEAQRTGHRLRLVHVVPEAVPMATMLPLYGAETLAEVGRRILLGAETLVKQLWPDAVVETALAHGPRTNGMLAHTHDAELVVLGRRPSLIAHIRTGSTSTAVAARADCPVVSVPEEWSHAVLQDRVVAAVDGTAVSKDVLAAAISAAHVRGARLVVLHAWRPMAPYENVLARSRAADTWERQAEPVMWAMVAGLRAEYPDVEVQVELHYERTADALVAAGRSADLMVMGRRGDGPFLGISLGAMTRALLRAGVCPVEVVPFPRGERRGLPRQAPRRAAADSDLPGVTTGG